MIQVLPWSQLSLELLRQYISPTNPHFKWTGRFAVIMADKIYDRFDTEREASQCAADLQAYFS